ncbi:RNA-directed DNA polymerase, eukaryota [Tanacetum coccineum]
MVVKIPILILGSYDFTTLQCKNDPDPTSFIHDKWYEGGVLKRLFPRVYALELDKNISVSSKLKAPSLVTTFRRNARSGIEQTQFDSMAEIMKTISLVPRVDRYIWSLENDGSFSVASIRKTLDDNRFQEESLSTRWVKSVPIKVNILAWKVKSNALPTRFNISRRGMDIDSIDCPICKMGVETTSHVFFQCNVVRQVMRKISSWWNVEYMEVNSYEEWRSWLVSTRIRSNIKVIIEGIYYGLWWVMWNFRNKILFDTKIPEKIKPLSSMLLSPPYNNQSEDSSLRTDRRTLGIIEAWRAAMEAAVGEVMRVVGGASLSDAGVRACTKKSWDGRCAKEDYHGSHTKTFTMDGGVDLDLGFMVFNWVGLPTSKEPLTSPHPTSTQEKNTLPKDTPLLQPTIIDGRSE